MDRLEAQLPFISLCRPLVAKGQNCTVLGPVVWPCPQRPLTEGEDRALPSVVTELPAGERRHSEALVRWENKHPARPCLSARENLSRSSFSQVLFLGAES